MIVNKKKFVEFMIHHFMHILQLPPLPRHTSAHWKSLAYQLTLNGKKKRKCRIPDTIRD